MTYIFRKCTQCPTCKKPIIFGRRDKVFCTLKCKNKHHKTARQQIRTRVNFHQELLRRNLVILEGIVGPKGKTVRVHKDALIKHGFELTVSSRAAIRRNRCRYEIGGYYYTIMNSGIIEIERIGEVSEYLPGFFERWEVEFPFKTVLVGDISSEGRGIYGEGTNSA